MVLRDMVSFRLSMVKNLKASLSFVCLLFGTVYSLPSFSAFDPANYIYQADTGGLGNAPSSTTYFADYNAGCQFEFDNICSANSVANQPGSDPNTGCVSGSFSHAGLNLEQGFVVCSGTATYTVWNNDNQKYEEKTSDTAMGLQTLPKAFNLADIDDAPQSQHCDGDPIDVNTGTLYENETDVSAKGDGQVEFIRYYSNTNSKGAWRYSYQQSLQVINIQAAQKFRSKAPGFYGDKESACSVGITQLIPRPTAKWFTNNHTVSLNGNVCQVMQNGKVVRNLIIMDQYKLHDVPVLSTVLLTRINGSAITFQQRNGVWLSNNGSSGLLQAVQNGNSAWRFTLNGIVEEYSEDGKLLSITAANGMKQTLTYDPVTKLLKQVQDATGRKLQFAFTNSKLTSVTSDNNKTTSYSYNTAGFINDVTHPDNTHRLYHYEDGRFPIFLTGITDELGIRYTTWTYDAQGHATSSEHTGGAEHTSFVFNSSSTTVTNTLNKQTIYNFADIAGSRKITSVQGVATANCFGAFQNYTYTPDGQIESKTDWRSNKTTYIYNTLGQEISRTEAANTWIARTITTEWDPILNRKTKVIEPEKETTFQYDANGFLLNQTIHSLTTQ